MTVSTGERRSPRALPPGAPPLVEAPGSAEAIDAGCSCPCIDNHHGHGRPSPDGGRAWITSDACPLHGAALMPGGQ